MNDLINSQCSSTPELLNESDIQLYLTKINSWDYDFDKKIISHEFKFKNYYQTIAFVNAVTWIVHQENHHPDITFSYNKCFISFSTHSVHGISKNDFICAVKINNLITT
ncbi:Pterin-4-alpha-carbinolamine dehydratase [hydrothermal vent metagenome]|uniref:4a-hydroxytetrahydrobiopterin dehydratase n=1 Tax=hydrothermal vent metagenome TaxID=652676 RepID=A0A3B1AGB5_9ZZZZ